jgi:predicted transcriptional regulator
MSSGDKVADDIFTALQSSDAGLSKTEISNLFNRNRTAKEIEAALQTLLELNRIEKVEEKTSGRPREVFKILAYEKDELNELSMSES